MTLRKNDEGEVDLGGGASWTSGGAIDARPDEGFWRAWIAGMAQRRRSRWLGSGVVRRRGRQWLGLGLGFRSCVRILDT